MYEKAQSRSKSSSTSSQQKSQISFEPSSFSVQRKAKKANQPQSKGSYSTEASEDLGSIGIPIQAKLTIQARAFTTGQDVFFRSGEYKPGNRGGQELIAHELTHVVQQSGGRTRLAPTSVVQKVSNNKGKQGKPSIKDIGGAPLSWEPSLTGPFYRYCGDYEVDVVNLQKGQYAYKESDKGGGAVWFTATSEVVGMLEERPYMATLSQIILPSGTSEEDVWLNYESEGKLQESKYQSRIIVKNNEPNNYGIGRNIYKASLSNITVKANPKYKGSNNKGKKKK